VKEAVDTGRYRFGREQVTRVGTVKREEYLMSRGVAPAGPRRWDWRAGTVIARDETEWGLSGDLIDGSRYSKGV